MFDKDKAAIKFQFQVTCLWSTNSCPFSSTLIIGSHQQRSESKWLRPIGISKGATAARYNAGFMKNTVKPPRIAPRQRQHRSPASGVSIKQLNRCTRCCIYAASQSSETESLLCSEDRDCTAHRSRRYHRHP